MSTNITAGDLGSALVRLDQTTMAVDLPAGSAIFIVRGEIWLTQEGLADDFVLAAGSRFDVRRRGTIVASATRDHADVYIASAERRAVDVGEDLHTWLQACAAAERSAAIARMADAAAAQLAQFGAGLRARLRGVTAKRMRGALSLQRPATRSPCGVDA